MALSPSKREGTVKANDWKAAAEGLISSNRYRARYEIEMPRGSEKVLQDGRVESQQVSSQPRSMFSNYHLVYVKRSGGGNYPLTEEEMGQNQELFKNVTLSDIVERPKGALIYKPEDFIYVKDYRMFPMNRLITLNRFAYPCFDDITSSEQLEPPVSTMVTYSTNEMNKFSEILSMSFGMRWKEMKSKIEKMQMQGDQSGISNGYMKNVLKYVDPQFGSNAIQGSTRLNYDPYHDENKVHGAVDVIDMTNIREIGLDFEHSITLKFRYELQSYKGLSGKAAFIDLISNFLLMTTQDAKFWGGARYWTGQRPSKLAMNMRMLQPRDFSSFLNQAHTGFKSWLGSLGGGGGGNAIETLKNVAKNVMNLAFGKLLDKVGRPSIPMMNSLLTGEPQGVYHLTIGNPLNPIMVIGNLINDGAANLTFGDELGYEDFPTSVEIEIKLKPAMPRGRQDIESMFNNGTRTYWKPKDLFNKGATVTNGSGNQVAEPRLLGDLVNSGIDNFSFGDFDKDAVLRNAQTTWSFFKL